MRDYELTILIKPELSEKDIDKEIKSLTSILEKAGAKILRKVDAAKKNLAYEVARFREAYYAYMELSLKPEDVSGVEQKLKLQDNIVRYLLVKKE